MANIDSINRKAIFALFLVHFSGDFFQSFVKPLLPVLATKFSLTLTQVGMIGGLSMLAAFFIQPIFGYLADCYRPRTIALTVYVTLLGLERLPYITLLGLLVFPFLMTLIPASEKSVIKEHTFFSTLRDSLGNVWRPILLIWTLAFTRALLEQATLTFIPMLFASEGHSLVSIGAVISLFTIGGSISSLICGHLVDRFGFRPIYFFSFALSPPCLYLFVHSSGWLTYAFAFVAGFIILATLFPAVALAQKVAPRSRSLVSSIIMGLTMGIGGILMPFIGSLADVFGVRPVLSGIALIPFGVLIFIRYLPDPR